MDGLVLKNVTKKYGNFTAVSDVSFTVNHGKILGLLGPNGAGKTSTIRMIASITIPDSGSIDYNGQPIGSETQNLMGYLPEERGLYKKMKVLEGIQFLGELKNMTATHAKKRGADLLERFGLSEWAEKKIDELSKGMQQKVQILSTIINDPDLIILDEPLSGLDPINSELVNEIIMEMKENGKTIIFSTHRMEQVEKICDEIVLINKSELVLSGNLRDIKQSFGKDSVIVEFDGDNSIFDSIKGISISDRNPKHVELRLNGLPIRELIQQINPVLDIHKVERVEPSLKEIFIETVTKKGGTIDKGVLA